MPLVVAVEEEKGKVEREGESGSEGKWNWLLFVLDWKRRRCWVDVDVDKRGAEESSAAIAVLSANGVLHCVFVSSEA